MYPVACRMHPFVVVLLLFFLRRIEQQDIGRRYANLGGKLPGTLVLGQTPPDRLRVLLLIIRPELKDPLEGLLHLLYQPDAEAVLRGIGVKVMCPDGNRAHILPNGLRCGEMNAPVQGFYLILTDPAGG